MASARVLRPGAAFDVKSAPSRALAVAAVMAWGLAGLEGCEWVLGLGGESALDAGADAAPRDAAAEHVEAAQPGSAAVVVGSSKDWSDWCAVTANGDVECWGNNESGELGNGTTIDSPTPVSVIDLPGPAASVSLGIGTACALLRGGAVYCWGVQFTNAGTTFVYSDKPVPVPGLGSAVTALSCGNGVNCAVKAGAVLCWGDAGNGLLGTGQMNDTAVPVAVPGLESGVTRVAVGGYAACAVKNGGVMCWGGFDGNDELGSGATNGSFTPVPVQGLTSGVADVSVGLDFVCALTGGGGVVCWGDGTEGALGNGELAVSPLPVQVKGLTSGVLAVSAGADSTSAIMADGSVVTWGFASNGELGNGSAESDSSTGGGVGNASSVPVKVTGLSSRAISISTGQAPCVATTAGTVECWGIIAEYAGTPVPVLGLDQVTAIATGGNIGPQFFTCAVAEAGVTYCWGGNAEGQLGDGTTTNSGLPVENATLFQGSTAVSGATGGDFACGVSSGDAYCWGQNGSGQLGNGGTVSSAMPVGVEGLTSGVTAISAGYRSACAITTAGADGGDAGGALYCWGDNTYGQLGNDSTTNSNLPVPVMGLGSGVVAVSCGLASVCALLEGGDVDCWGLNANGQLGDGTMTLRLVPTPVVDLGGAKAISVGWYSACAIGSQSTVLCWGSNETGELGDNTLNSSLVPVPVASIFAGATQVSVGATMACAVVAGAAQCWGFGPLGDDSPPGSAQTSPVPVTGLGAGVSAVAVGNEYSCAVVNGGVQCWGYNSSGQLGNGGAVDAFVPTRIPGFP